MRSCFYFVIQILLVVFILLLKQGNLFALDCKNIFSYVQDKSYSRSIPINELSGESSSYDRFIRGVSGAVDKRSLVQLEGKIPASLEQIPYPVVDIDVYLKTGSEEFVVSGLVINPYMALVVFDENMDKNDIKAVFYKDIKLNIIDEKEYSGKKVYTLIADSKFTLSDSSLEQNQNNQSIRQFLSLYNIPQSSLDLHSFMYPPVGSVVKLFVRKNFFSKDDFLDDNRVVISDDSPLREELGITDRRIKTATASLSPESGSFKVLVVVHEYILWTVNRFLSYRSTGGFCGRYDDSDRATINLLSKILSSPALIKSYSKIFAPNRSLYKIDVDKWVVGYDDTIAEMVRVFLSSELEKADTVTQICKRYGLDRDKELKKAYKKVIWALGRHQYRKDKGFFRGNVKDFLEPSFVGYATVVSSNTVMTVTSNIYDNMLEEDERSFSDEVSVQKGDRFVDALAISSISYKVDNSKLKLSLIRFPEGTFTDLPQAKIGYYEDESRGIVVTESKDSNMAVTLVDICKDQDSCFYNVNPVRNWNLESDEVSEVVNLSTAAIRRKDNSFKQGISPSQKGLPVFGSKDQLIGILRGSEEQAQISMLSRNIEAYLKQAINEDPKLKIRGINE